ncbi:hypothetical protein KJ877_00820 [bacterium]|nr:hypothetical protein [bacterium]MBU1989570.1 hypothetical protein [bacterium]
MSTNLPSIKRHNHIIHPCLHKQKTKLLELLLEQNSERNILLVTQNNFDELKHLDKGGNFRVTNDELLAELKDFKADILISYDLPDEAALYMKRLAATKEKAIILLDDTEHTLLYPVETLLGRTVRQEIVSGFEPEPIQKPRQEEKPSQAKEFQSKKTSPRKPGEFKSEFKKKEYKSDKKTEFGKKEYKSDKQSEYKPKSYDKKSSDARNPKENTKPQRWEKKEREASKYIGKDENGKAMFSGKTRERNHAYDGTPKDNGVKRTVRKINIKPKKEESKEK